MKMTNQVTCNMKLKLPLKPETTQFRALFHNSTMFVRLLSALTISACLLMTSPSIIAQTVSKSGSVASPVSAGTADTATVDWVVDYDNNTGAPIVNELLEDTWTSPQTLVPTSIQIPDGWTSNQLGPLQLNFNANFVPDGTNGVTQQLPRPNFDGVFNTSGAGDGLNPALTDNNRIYAVPHHELNAWVSACIDLFVGNQCAGISSGSYAANDTNISSSVITGNYPITIGIGNKIYWSDGGLGNGGFPIENRIFCWDATTDAPCDSDMGTPNLQGGFTNSIGDFHNGLELINGRLYTIRQDPLDALSVDCYDPALDLAQCVGYPVSIGLYPLDESHLHHLSIGNRVYVVLGNQGTVTNASAARIECVDTTTGATCGGLFPISPLLDNAESYAIWPRLSPAGVETGFCVSYNNNGTVNPDTTCYDLDGANPTNIDLPGNVQSASSSGRIFPSFFAVSGSRVFLQSGLNNFTKCWDWTDNAGAGGPCTGSGFDANGHVSPDQGGYGSLAIDSCVYIYGHDGDLIALDAQTGEMGQCTVYSGITEALTNRPSFYCADPSLANDSTWNEVIFTGVDLNAAANEVTVFTFQLVDPATDTVVYGPINAINDADGIFDISASAVPGIDAFEELRLEVTYDDASGVGSTWTDGSIPSATLTFNDSDPVQFCFQTEASVDCGATGSVTLSNTIEEVTVNATDISNVEACVVDQLTLTKNDDGNGPYSPGDALVYTLVVTNTGIGNANNVQVTDTIPATLTRSTATTTTQGSCDDSGDPLVVCNIGTLTPGQSETVTITTTVN